MKLNKSFSNLAKNLSKSAEATVKKSEDLFLISKLSLEISSKESSIEALYIEIGKKVYEKYSKEKFSDHDLEEYFKTISRYQKDIKELKKEISKTKDKGNCLKCGNEISKSSKYCPICGQKQDR